MPSKKKIAYALGIVFAVLCLNSLNIAMPTTIKVKDAVTGQPAAGAYVVSYLAIRDIPFGNDGGQSLSRIAVTNDKGEAYFDWDCTWVFFNGFQDYNSRILVYKPKHAPHIVMGAFNIRYALVVLANPKKQEIGLSDYNSNLEKKSRELDSFMSQLSRVYVGNSLFNDLAKAYESERAAHRLNP